MDFELSEDQLELQQVVRSLVERECPPALVRAVAEGEDDGDAFWKTLVDGHWPGLAAPESVGGSGATAVELAVVIELLGWVADPTPYLATTTQYLPLVLECASTDPRASLAGAVCAGGTGAVAFAVREVQATPASGGWTLHGTARYSMDADRADHVAVVASTPDGPGVFVVPRSQITATRITTVDAALHLADLAFEHVTVGADLAFCGPEVATGIARARQVAVMGVATTMVGASQRILELALEHVRHRRQFDVPIGSFQSIKHMAVDMYVGLERARALCQFAALTIAEDDPRRELAASMAKTAAGDCQRVVAQHGLQLFGALGFTWENDLHLYLRRAKAGEFLLGTSTEHRALVARATLDDERAMEAVR